MLTKLRAITSLTNPQTVQTNSSRFKNILYAIISLNGLNIYFQNKWINAKNQDESKIMERVSKGETLESQQDLIFARENYNIEGSKVTLTGELQPGRFIVKRNRGDQEGYMVFAPFVVKRIKNSVYAYGKSVPIKYMLKLGWVPKESKHKIKETAAINALEFDEVPDYLADVQSAAMTSTITGYVRRGQTRDILRGYNNWPSQYLYKFIDLNLMCNIFGCVNDEARQIYIDRIKNEDAEDSFPFPNIKQNYLMELKDNQRNNDCKFQERVLGFFSASVMLPLII